ncbi:hypothetical protein BLOT_010648 [Blomia tropicalis]|nr:hypothetical protein BLOT_010648 [Blomia tropicalis]
MVYKWNRFNGVIISGRMLYLKSGAVAVLVKTKLATMRIPTLGTTHEWLSMLMTIFCVYDKALIDN